MRRWLALAYSAVVLGAGFTLGRGCGREDDAASSAPEPPSPEERRADGSVVLAREPLGPEAPPPKTPELPRRATAERVVRTVLRPDPPTSPAEPCPDVEVQWTLARLPDGTARVVVDSPNASVVRGSDVPLATVSVPPATRRWAGGVSARLTGRNGQAAVGPFLERDVGRLRLGASLLLARDGRVEVEARVGATF